MGGKSATPRLHPQKYLQVENAEENLEERRDAPNVEENLAERRDAPNAEENLVEKDAVEFIYYLI